MTISPTQVAYALVLLLLLTAGCASVAPEAPVPQPRVVATQPATAPPAAKAGRPVTPQPAKVSPPVPRTPAPVARGPKPAAPSVTSPPARAVATLDLKALTQRLKTTTAIGIFTKIALKNQVDDLMQHFREYYQGKATFTMTELRGSYNMLMMKVLSLLQDSDLTLASAIVSSREAIWGLLADPDTFAALQI